MRLEFTRVLNGRIGVITECFFAENRQRHAGYFAKVELSHDLRGRLWAASFSGNRVLRFCPKKGYNMKHTKENMIR